MEEFRLILDLVLAVSAAFAGGVIAQRLRQPAILGYLVAGVALGPFTPGPVADIRSIQTLADIGVAFLMFALGAEFSLAELQRFGRAATLGGAFQIACTMALGPLVAPALGLDAVQGVFLGALLALSSTVVAMKVLMDRGELQAYHGRVALGLLVVQDIAVVPMVIVLPSLAAGGEGLWTNLALAFLKAGAVVAGVYLMGTRLVPWVLRHAAVTRTRELFLLSIVALALGMALLTQLAGLSFAFGAFLAGLVVAESEYRTQVIAEAIPFRDLFASLFFVSIGMLVNPATLIGEAGPVALLIALSALGKTGIVVLALVLLRTAPRVAVLAAFSVAQVGEFSFVLARVGVEGGAVPERLLDLTLGTALVTILITPAMVRAAPKVLEVLGSLPVLGPRFAEPAEALGVPAGLSGHAIICGYGQAGRELAAALQARGVRFLVIDYNPSVVRDLRAREVPVVYGDAGNPSVLDHAHVASARLLAALLPDSSATERATRYGRSVNPRLDIVARANRAEDLEALRRAGADQVVQPEFEAGLEVIRHALRRYGVHGPELTALVSGRRERFYRRGG